MNRWDYVHIYKNVLVLKKLLTSSIRWSLVQRKYEFHTVALQYLKQCLMFTNHDFIFCNKQAGGRMSSDYIEKIKATAINEYNHYSAYGEQEEPLRSRIESYYNDLGIAFPGVNKAWSAIFISWVMSTNEGDNHTFPVSTMHSFYFNRAIKNRLMNSGYFIGWKITEYAPSIGDLIQGNRGGNNFDYEYAANNMWYESHSVLIVGFSESNGKTYAVTIGGNENVGSGSTSLGTVGSKKIELDSNGFIIQKDNNPYICIMQNMK